MALTYDPTLADEATSFFQEAADTARLTDDYKETAANRLTSRLAAKQRADERAVRNRYASLGRSGSGAVGTSLQRVRNDSTSALASGLADLEEGFFSNKLNSSQAIQNAGKGLLDVAGGKLSADTAAEGYAIDRENLAQDASQEAARLDAQKKNDFFNNLISFFSQFGQFGNLQAGGASAATNNQFNQQQDDLLKALFGAIGAGA